MNARTLISFVAATFLIAHASAETHFVAVDGSGFAPSTLNINVGDTVVWTSYDEFFPHTTTSDLSIIDPDYWNGSLFDFEDTFEKTFQNPGTFTYHDDADIGTGTITVSDVPAPIITLQAPRVEEGEFLLDVTGLTVGKTNIVELSIDLIQWMPVKTNIAVATSMTFTNAIHPGGYLFRVLELSAPNLGSRVMRAMNTSR